MSSLLPPNSTALERAIEGAMASPITAIEIPISQLWNPQTCPLHMLPYLAWALSVDEWDPNWSEEDQRNVVAESVELHRLKGTLGSIKRVLKSAGYGDATVLENLDAQLRDGSVTRNGHHVYGGSTGNEGNEWAQYRVYLTRPITIEQATQVRRLLNNTAPARCHLAGLHFDRALHLHNGTLMRDGQFTRGVA